MRGHFALVALLLLLCPRTHGAEVTIWGTDSAYAGEKIELLLYHNEITYDEVLLASATVSKSGAFRLNFELNETRYVFAYLGIYKVFLYAEPGGNYHVLLPPRKDKDPADLLNPYFSPTDVHLALSEFEKNELNTQIRMFEDAYLPYSNKHIMAIRNNEDFSDLDNDIVNMDKPFARSDHAFFNNYRRYRYARLRHLAYQQKSRSISDEYFKDQPVLLNNPPYMELFNQVYDKYFHHFARTDSGIHMAEALSAGNVKKLRRVLSSDAVLGNGELRDLVILKGLYEEFYDDNYSRSALLDLLDSYIAEDDFPRFTDIAGNIRKNATRLLTGFEPPEFKLYDRDSALVSLENFSGKYVYLNFCSCFSYTCLNEFKMLEKLYEKHGKILEVVTIIIDNDYDVINGFLERSNYQWTFLHYGRQSSVIRDYDIRAFPTYYLIDPDGKLVISPAPSPGDEIEARLFRIMRERGEL